MGDSHASTESREGKEEDPFPLTERDRIGLSLKDEDFQLHTWEALKVVIGKRDILPLSTPPYHLLTTEKTQTNSTSLPGSPQTFVAISPGAIKSKRNTAASATM